MTKEAKQSLLESIAASEYNIRRDAAHGSWASPNRAHNLRARYHETGFSLEPRLDSLENWNLQYAVKGLYRSNGCVLAPQGKPTVDNKDNKLTFHFANGFHIEYVNSAQGMRQNFLVDQKPSGDGMLRVVLATQGSLYPVKKGTGDVVLVEENPATGALVNRTWYKDLRVLDATGKQIPASVEVGKVRKEGDAYLWHSEIALQVDDKDATYPLWIDPISTTAAAMVERNQAMAQLGSSVSSAGDVNGDGYSDVIVGATGYDNGQTDEGAAFIYHGSATGISTTAATMLESNQANANFGWSVSTAGDVNGDGYSDVIVGAPYYDVGGANAGMIFIYHGSSSGVSTTAAATRNVAQANANFGTSVASAGDLNNDGYSDVVAGAPHYDIAFTDEGGALVFHGSASGIVSSPSATVLGGQGFAKFGYSVASGGDLNNDGYSDLLVGAPYYDKGQANEGAVFAFKGSATGMSATLVDTLEANTASGSLGWSVACAGDVNGDGFSDVVAGAPFFANDSTNEGAAYIFHGNALGVSSTVIARVEGNQAVAQMGNSVSSAGDVNGDGYSDVIVGAGNYDNGDTDEGAAFLYQGSATGISTTASALFECNSFEAFFGTVASAGDVNGDGYSDLVIGASGYSSPESYEGAFFVYHGAPGGVSTTSASTYESNQNTGYMGFSVASAGDVNGDGHSDVIVGAYGYDNGSTDEGAAFIYHGSATGLASTPAIMLESNFPNTFMGVSVASAGDVNGDGFSDVIVGAMGYSSIEPFEGGAFVYHGSASGITTPAAAIVESNQLNATLGRCVSSAGDVNGDGYSDVIVGSPLYDNGSTDEGACFIYHGSASGISTTAAASVESNQASANMGLSVASAGDVNGDGFSDVVVAAFNYDNGQTDEGRVYIYHGSATGINTTAAATVESNQAGANMGTGVASAGDVNGDGFSDVVVGSLNYSRGETNEGAAFVYHGSASGMGTTAVDTLDPNIAFAAYGSSVASAGDVNGDGYSDLVVGAQFAANGQSNEGIVYVYHGSPTGVINTPAATFERNQANAALGTSVASAGDVNGDGYSDIIMGAYNYDNGQSDEGAVFVHYGNGGSGLPTMVRQFRPTSTTPVGPGGLSETSGQIRLSMNAKSFIGRQQGRMVYEYKTEGAPFSSAGGKVTNSVASSGSTVNGNMTGSGSVVNADLTGLSPTASYKWRARVRYNPATAITGQMYGPWYYHKSRTPEVPMLGFRAKPSCTVSSFSTCPPAINLNNGTGICTAIANYTAIATATPSPTLSYTFSGATTGSGSGTGSGSAFNEGVTTVTVTASNSCGPVACSFSVTVYDTTQPTAVCRNLTTYLNGSGSASITGASVNNGSTDNCTAAGNLTFSLTSFNFGCANIGANTTTLIVTDQGGNIQTCTSTITVADTMDPIAVCRNATVYLNAAGSASLAGATINNGSTDNCTAAGSLVLSPSVSSFSCANIGSNSVTLTVTDAQGNARTCSSTVTVVDTLDPTAVCSTTTLSLNAAGTATLAASAVNNGSSDNCTAAGSLSYSVSPSSFSCANLGSNTATLTVTDASGNSRTCATTVTVTDPVAPTAACQNLSLVLNAAGTASAAASAVNNGSSDNCTSAGSLGLSLSSSTFTCANLGANSVTLTVTDGSGNTSTCTSTITVSDTTAPAMLCAPTTVQLTAGGFALINPATLDGGSSDNCGISSFTVSMDTVTCNDAGGIQIVLTGTDASGNTASCTAPVNVVDTAGVTDPGVNLGPDTYICTGTLVLDAGPGYASYSWSTGATTQTISTTVPGTYTVNVVTAFGCQGTDQILVSPGVMPTVNLGADTVQCGGSIAIDAGNPGATYAWSNAATSQVISVTTSGTYTVTVTLGPGCVATDDITVTIHPLPSVTFDYPDDTICKELGPVTLTGASPAGGTWSGPGVTGSTFDPDAAGLGIHTLTYTYTDMTTGCEASATDVVVVEICTGVENQQPGFEAAIYPNPNNGIFALQVNGLSGETLSVEVWSADGKQVFQHHATSVFGLSTTPMDLSHLSKGIYMVNVRAGAQQQVLRVVTQ